MFICRLNSQCQVGKKNNLHAMNANINATYNGMSLNILFVCVTLVSQLVTEEFTEMSQKLELEQGLRQHAEVVAHQVRARGTYVCSFVRLCACVFTHTPRNSLSYIHTYRH